MGNVFSTPSKILSVAPFGSGTNSGGYKISFICIFGVVFFLNFLVKIPPQTLQNAHSRGVHLCVLWDSVFKAEADTRDVAGGKMLQQNPHRSLSRNGVLRHQQREQLIPKTWKQELSRPHRFRNHRLKKSLPEENSPRTCFLEAGWCLT